MLHNNTAEPEFKGYTFDELRYQRAYTLAKYEMAKMQLADSTHAMRRSLPFGSKSGLMSRILGNLNYIDYALMAYKVVNKIIKFRRSTR